MSSNCPVKIIWKKGTLVKNNDRLAKIHTVRKAGVKVEGNRVQLSRKEKSKLLEK